VSGYPDLPTEDEVTPTAKVLLEVSRERKRQDAPAIIRYQTVELWVEQTFRLFMLPIKTRIQVRADFGEDEPGLIGVLQYTGRGFPLFFSYADLYEMDKRRHLSEITDYAQKAGLLP